MTHDDKLVRDVATDIEAVLRDLKFRATGQDPKNTGYEYAEVPAWRLRQWCAAIAVVKASAEAEILGLKTSLRTEQAFRASAVQMENARFKDWREAEAENARLRKALEEMLDANAELAEFVGLSDMSGDNFANACAQMGRAVDAARAALSAPDAGASKDEGK